MNAYRNADWIVFEIPAALTQNDAMPEWVMLHNPLSRNGSRAERRTRSALHSRKDGAGPRLVWVALSALHSLERVPERIIVIGGDGTVNAAAEWLIERRASCPIAILPAGTGNNLACGLGLPLDLAGSLRVALGGERTRPLDVIVYRGLSVGGPRVVVQSAALGFPADIARRYDVLRRRPLLGGMLTLTGQHVYRLLALLGLQRQKRMEARGERLLEVECVLPDEVLRETVFAIFIGNERSLGGNFLPCPRAELDDGMFDICFVRAGTGARYLKLFRAVARGEHLEMRDTVLYRQTPGPVALNLSAPGSFLADGDIHVTDRAFRLEVLPGRLEVIVGESPDRS
ncbi:MAG TPA: diacylglycerol kinase family protein [Planctomycetota bacterium]|nr:diacylglycerol kinase family protein [Planctomycetota bacterium]